MNMIQFPYMKRTLKSFFILFCLLTVVFAFTSCSKAAQGVEAATEDMAVMEESVVMTKAMNAASPKAAIFSDTIMASPTAESEVQARGFNESGSSQEKGTAQELERKLIKNGSIRLQVENLASAEEAVSAWCTSFGGYISSSYSEERHASFTARVPASKFDTAMTSIGEIGVVKSRSISTQDVSEQFYDLQTRLETRKILRDRLQSYLASAKDMKDMLQIETELNNTLSEIESMEGRMRRLSGQIEYSTINVEMELPYRTTDQGFQWPEFGRGFRRFISNVVDFFAGFVALLLYIVIFGIPILAAVAFFYWLLLGKVGLLRKIFKRLGKKKD